MSDELLTVAEYCAKHCKDEPGDQRTVIQAHVDTLVFGAISTGHSLWKVGIDPDGRVSLIWASMPEPVWDALLERAMQVAMLQKMIGGLL